MSEAAPRGPRWLLTPLGILCLGIALSLGMTLALEDGLYRPLGHGVDVNDRPIGQDFINIWSGPYFAFHGRMNLLFDRDAYTIAIGKRFGHALQFYSWSYPPHTLLLYYPFSLPPYFVSYALWTALGLAAWLGIYRLYAGRIDLRAALLLCLSPACAINVIDGQNSFFVAALFIGGLLALRRYPILAGVLFGILTFKPQIGIILPFALIAMRQWRVIAYAAATFWGLLVGSVFVMGIDPWVQYVTVTSGWQTGALLSTEGLFSYMGVAPLTGLLVLGVPQNTALVLQILVTLFVIGVSYQAVRRTSDLRQRIFVLCSAVPLVSPYLLDYDLCLLTIPLTLRILTMPPANVRSRLLYLGAWLMPTLGLVLALSPIRPLQALAPLILFAVFVTAIADVEKAADGNTPGTALD